MSKIINAVFENGAFKPLDEVSAKEHEKFKIIFIPIEEEDSFLHLLKLAEDGGSFSFLKENQEDIYTAQDGEEL